MADDFTVLQAANMLVTARTLEGLSDQTYRTLYMEAVREHGVKLVDALVVLSRLMGKEAATANGVELEKIFQHYGAQFKALEKTDI